MVKKAPAKPTPKKRTTSQVGRKPPAKTPAKPKGKTYRDYSDEDKVAALGLLAWNKGNVLKTAKSLGIPESTIRKWIKEKADEPAIAAAVTAVKATISSLIEDSIRKALVAGDDKLKKATLPQIKDHIAMLTEKYQLINEKPTAIHGIQGNDKLARLAEILSVAKERKEEVSSK